MLLRQVQEVDEEVHARLRLLLRQAVDPAEEGQRVADVELVVERQVLRDTNNVSLDHRVQTSKCVEKEDLVDPKCF